jgi:hypothetical protein
MKHFFYDQALARMALRANDLNIVHVQHTLSDIAEHLQDRWRDLHDHTSARFQTFLIEMLAPKNNAETGFAAAEREVIDDLTFLAGLRTALLAIQVFWPKLFRYRHILRYSGRRIFITTKEDGWAELRRERGGPVLLTCPAVPLADKGEYEGTVGAICSFAGDVRAVVVLGESGLVAAWDPITGNWNEEATIKELDHLPPMQLVIAAAAHISEAVTDRVKRLSEPAREVFEMQHRQAKDFAKFLYLQIMFPYWQPNRRNSAGDVLLERGFANVFAEPDLPSVARYSIAFGGPGRSVEEGARLLGSDKTRVQDQLNRINETTNAKLGLDMMHREGETVTSLL